MDGQLYRTSEYYHRCCSNTLCFWLYIPALKTTIKKCGENKPKFITNDDGNWRESDIVSFVKDIHFTDEQIHAIYKNIEAEKALLCISSLFDEDNIIRSMTEFYNNIIDLKNDYTFLDDCIRTKSRLVRKHDPTKTIHYGGIYYDMESLLDDEINQLQILKKQLKPFVDGTEFDVDKYYSLNKEINRLLKR